MTDTEQNEKTAPSQRPRSRAGGRRPDRDTPVAAIARVEVRVSLRGRTGGQRKPELVCTTAVTNESNRKRVINIIRARARARARARVLLLGVVDPPPERRACDPSPSPSPNPNPNHNPNRNCNPLGPC